MAHESSPVQASLKPIPIGASFLDGKGLAKGDPQEFSDGDISTEDGSASFSQHTFFTGKIVVAVYESEPSKVRIDGLPYDEFIQVLEGRLILTTDDGDTFEFKEGDSLTLPQGFVGFWEMPETYRELIVINADYEQP
ncbi:MAG: cupin domain-containing protein [Pseudomonadota bacterium]